MIIREYLNRSTGKMEISTGPLFTRLLFIDETQWVSIGVGMATLLDQNVNDEVTTIREIRNELIARGISETTCPDGVSFSYREDRWRLIRRGDARGTFDDAFEVVSGDQFVGAIIGRLHIFYRQWLLDGQAPVVNHYVQLDRLSEADFFIKPFLGMVCSDVTSWRTFIVALEARVNGLNEVLGNAHEFGSIINIGFLALNPYKIGIAGMLGLLKAETFAELCSQGVRDMRSSCFVSNILTISQDGGNGYRIRNRRSPIIPNFMAHFSIHASRMVDIIED